VTLDARAQPHEPGGAAGAFLDGDDRESRLLDFAATVREFLYAPMNS
jgi:hypothetical protein